FVEEFNKPTDYDNINIVTVSDVNPGDGAGDYNVTLKYFWSKDRNKEIDVEFEKGRTLREINKDYAENVLFRVPFDGSRAVDWGTGFSSKNISNFYLNSDESDEENAVQAKRNGNTTATLNYQSNYPSTKDGQIISVRETKITYSPSEPIILVASVDILSAEKAGGFLYTLNNKSASRSTISEDLTWRVTSSTVSGYTKGTLETESHIFSDFCPRISGIGNNVYDGFKIDGGDRGKVVYETLIFIPAKTSDSSNYKFNLQCIAQGGQVSISYIENSIPSEIDEATSGNRTVNITREIKQRTDTLKLQTRYNLQNLLTMVRDNEVCLSVESNELNIFWNDSGILENQ
ncbi:hypothetical protein IIC68_01800, partial [archaeon]|nr:hypothetical protein [archaeon]